MKNTRTHSRMMYHKNISPTSSLFDSSVNSNLTKDERIWEEDDGYEEGIYVPPFEISPEMQETLTFPSSKKQHLLIECTAQFIRREGDGAEFRLKLHPHLLRQVPFISVEHPLFLYYEYLKKSGNTLYEHSPEDIPAKAWDVYCSVLGKEAATTPKQSSASGVATPSVSPQSSIILHTQGVERAEKSAVSASSLRSSSSLKLEVSETSPSEMKEEDVCVRSSPLLPTHAIAEKKSRSGRRAAHRPGSEDLSSVMFSSQKSEGEILEDAVSSGSSYQSVNTHTQRQLSISPSVEPALNHCEYAEDEEGGDGEGGIKESSASSAFLPLHLRKHAKDGEYDVVRKGGGKEQRSTRLREHHKLLEGVYVHPSHLEDSEESTPEEGEILESRCKSGVYAAESGEKGGIPVASLEQNPSVCSASFVLKSSWESNRLVRATPLLDGSGGKPASPGYYEDAGNAQISSLRQRSTDAEYSAFGESSLSSARLPPEALDSKDSHLEDDGHTHTPLVCGSPRNSALSSAYRTEASPSTSSTDSNEEALPPKTPLIGQEALCAAVVSPAATLEVGKEGKVRSAHLLLERGAHKPSERVPHTPPTVCVRQVAREDEGESDLFSFPVAQPQEQREEGVVGYSNPSPDTLYHSSTLSSQKKKGGGNVLVSSSQAASESSRSHTTSSVWRIGSSPSYSSLLATSTNPENSEKSPHKSLEKVGFSACSSNIEDDSTSNRLASERARENENENEREVKVRDARVMRDTRDSRDTGDKRLPPGRASTAGGVRVDKSSTDHSKCPLEAQGKPSSTNWKASDKSATARPGVLASSRASTAAMGGRSVLSSSSSAATEGGSRTARASSASSSKSLQASMDGLGMLLSAYGDSDDVSATSEEEEEEEEEGEGEEGDERAGTDAAEREAKQADRALDGFSLRNSRGPKTALAKESSLLREAPSADASEDPPHGALPALPRSLLRGKMGIEWTPPSSILSKKHRSTRSRDAEDKLEGKMSSESVDEPFPTSSAAPPSTPSPHKKNKSALFSMSLNASSGSGKTTKTTSPPLLQLSIARKGVVDVESRSSLERAPSLPPTDDSSSTPPPEEEDVMSVSSLGFQGGDDAALSGYSSRTQDAAIVKGGSGVTVSSSSSSSSSSRGGVLEKKRSSSPLLSTHRQRLNEEDESLLSSSSSALVVEEEKGGLLSSSRLRQSSPPGGGGLNRGEALDLHHGGGGRETSPTRLEAGIGGGWGSSSGATRNTSSSSQLPKHLEHLKLLGGGGGGGGGGVYANQAASPKLPTDVIKSGVVYVSFGASQSKEEEDRERDSLAVAAKKGPVAPVIPAVCWKSPTAELHISDNDSLIIQEISYILLQMPIEFAEMCVQLPPSESSRFFFLRPDTMENRYFNYIIKAVHQHMKTEGYSPPADLTHRPCEKTEEFLEYVEGKVSMMKKKVLLEALELERKKRESSSFSSKYTSSSSSSSKTYTDASSKKSQNLAEYDMSMRVQEIRRKKAKLLLESKRHESPKPYKHKNS